MRVLVFAGCEGVPADNSGWSKPDMHGGLHSMSKRMARALSGLGHEVEIAFLAKGNSLRFSSHRSPYADWNATNFTSLRQSYVLFHTLAWDDHLRRYIASFDAVVAVVGSPYVTYPLLDGDVPVLIWSAVTFEEDLKGRYDHFSPVRKLAYDAAIPFLRYQERRAFERCDHFFALSPSTLADFEAATRGRPADRTSLLYAPIDVETFSPRATPRDEPIVLFTGRYNDHRKATPRLLRAFRRVVDELPQAKLRLVGDNTSDDVRRHIADLRLESAVETVGLVSFEELLAQYEQAQVFIVPSEQEGLCISGVEAMGCGLPVVSTRCGGPEAYVEHEVTGLLAEQNEASIAEQLLRVLRDDALRTRMGEEARARALRDFSAERFQSIIDTALRRRCGSPATTNHRAGAPESLSLQ